MPLSTLRKGEANDLDRPSAPATSARQHRGQQEAALQIAQGVAGPETQELAAKLEKMIGVSIAELAVHADGWRES